MTQNFVLDVPDLLRQITEATERAEQAEKERDDLRGQLEEAREMAAQFCEQAAEWSGKLNASLTEQMRENCDACKEMAPAFTNKALRTARECREVLGEVVRVTGASDVGRGHATRSCSTRGRGSAR